MECLGDVGLEGRRVDGGEQPGVVGPPQVGQVRGDEHVGRGVRPLLLEPFEQLRAGAAAQLDVDAGLLLEVLEDLFAPVVRTPVVDDEGRPVVPVREDGHGHHGDEEHQDGHGDRPAHADETGDHHDLLGGAGGSVL